jgi:hypothetical protein
MTVLSELLPYKCGEVDWEALAKQLIVDVCDINRLDESKHNSIHKFTLELMDHLSIKTPIDIKQRIAFANIYLQLALSPGASKFIVCLLSLLTILIYLITLQSYSTYYHNHQI